MGGRIHWPSPAWATPVLLLGILGTVPGLAGGCGTPGPAAEITVAAAADLTGAFPEMARAFQASSGTRVVLILGSSGQLAQQIAQGAPVDVFAAADEGYVNGLEARGLVLPDTKFVYAQGRLALWTPSASPLRLESLSDLLRPEVRRIALANPDHAPYGIAARETLVNSGLWDSLYPKLVFGENVRQAQQYVETGNVDAAFLALSLCINSPGHYVLVPQELHHPLRQTAAVIKGSRNEGAARGFLAFLAAPSGRSILSRYGFALPEEEKRR
ncbi:MAG: molybdate ABC transporter substrate-binding protein [Chloroflexota bacterium]